MKMAWVDLRGSRSETKRGALRRMDMAVAMIAATAMLGLAGCGKPFAAVLEPSPPSLAAPTRSDNFQAIASNGDVAVAANGASALLVSSDAGRTWKRHALGARVSIIDLVACPDGKFHGIDFYGKVWIGSTDANTWGSRDLGADFTPLALSCAPDGKIWVVGSHATIASSIDGGKSWHVTSENEDAMLRAVQCVDATTGFVVGEFGRVLRTDDGGKTWSSPGQLGEDFYPYAMLFEDARRGWVSGLAGTVLRTGDGGVSWTREENASGGSIYALLQKEGRLYGFGEGGRILRRNQDGWRALDQGVEGAPFLNGAVKSGEANVLVAGPGGVLANVNLHTDGAQR